MVYFTEISRHTLTRVISLRETPNAVKLRFLSVPTLKNTSNLVGE